MVLLNLLGCLFCCGCCGVKMEKIKIKDKFLKLFDKISQGMRLGGLKISLGIHLFSNISNTIESLLVYRFKELSEIYF